ncbi:aminoadipic semialdehyde synthase [Aspergillus aculeatinus CBS 121060]|uniref:Aminoadipic semialdehyde synthase n=1 Tax=Aspergillus aculeatinus CBS 121060 TaxID=1448322 RepID=A0ACD1HJV3_9EURO|nr:aminoadipic semialdehyde synthase [Aspergillus aculeatinus CBS 121060]RAH73889.1 aminoadipic semialdehyde synthase [Aspergillus aculeatinus CBS 121060]
MSSAAGKRALLLGAGFVCEPAVQALSDAGVHVTVACRTLSAAQSLAGNYSNTTAIALDVANEPAKLDATVSQADLIISLIPYIYHATVVKAAIAHSKPVVTTSFISPALRELDSTARSAGVTVLNEIGLDPGIDHLYAVKTIDEVHRAGGKIHAFTSWCGALPAPENSDNPLGYKFSWSPRGGLLALLNSAQWYRDGQITSVEGKDLMAAATAQGLFPGFNFVGYPNRDSAGLRGSYAIPEAHTVFRGTLRYAGFPEVIRALVGLGYFSQDKLPALASDFSGRLTWAQLTAQLLGLAASASAEDVQDAVVRKCSLILAEKGENKEEIDRVLSSLRWLGLFDGTRLVDGRDTPLDTLCAVLERQMAYQPGERDMIVLQHLFEIENADGSRERRTSTLVEYGEPVGPGSRSAMAKLVGLPCAVGVLAVLEGRIQEKGMVAPWTNARIAETLREELKARFQIELKENIVG